MYADPTAYGAASAAADFDDFASYGADHAAAERAGQGGPAGHDGQAGWTAAAVPAGRAAAREAARAAEREGARTRRVRSRQMLLATGAGVVGLGALTVLGFALSSGSEETSRGGNGPNAPGLSVGDMADPGLMPSVEASKAPATVTPGAAPSRTATATATPSATRTASPTPTRKPAKETSPSASPTVGWPEYDDGDDDDGTGRGNGWGNSTRRPR
ncbi:hypothetical protein [Streptomyces sp. CO7]